MSRRSSQQPCDKPILGNYCQKQIQVVSHLPLKPTPAQGVSTLHVHRAIICPPMCSFRCPLTDIGPGKLQSSWPPTTSPTCHRHTVASLTTTLSPLEPLRSSNDRITNTVQPQQATSPCSDAPSVRPKKSLSESTCEAKPKEPPPNQLP